ncbi:MAG: ATP-dependent RNA helicase HrpA [Gammaproteobacteria bacterium]|nr:MAG: ATP-dependent RNA helicase HrpA [Gammaproteobacteria bacterium]
MNYTGNRSDREQLERLLHALDACLVRDIPALARQLATLQRRSQRGQSVDRGIDKLHTETVRSIGCVDQRRANAPLPRYPLALPVVEKREHIRDTIGKHPVVILCGETGSGKTTQLPKICLEMGRGLRGKIGHTQPRRIAARSLAGRIAEELDSPLGEQVGYKVRFQDRVQPHSYVKVMTDGILLAEIQSDPELREYDTLIIDEAHERSLGIDFLLGYLQRLLPRRPDLKLIITSATIDPQRFSSHFNGAPIVEVSGRTWPVEMRYRPVTGEDEDQKDRGRGQALLDAVDELAAEGPGDVLVFLPGERAIRESSELLRKHHPPQTEIVPLYARLSAAQQSKVFRPHKGRRIVLATNVAETSLTVPGIRYVVDTGLARVSRYSYRSKIQRLPIEAVSQASANQRAGRCGRVAAGVCIRLYSEDDYLSRAVFTEPEIQRTNLAAVILRMAVLELGDIAAFPFVDPPDARFIHDGYKLLYELGVVDGQQVLTALGRKVARLSVDPRLARMILAASELHCLTEVLVIVSALEVVDPRERPLDKAQAADQKHALFKDEKSDFMAYLNLWKAYREHARHLTQNKLRTWCREHFVSFMRMREWVDVHKQLLVQVRDMGMSCNEAIADYRSIHCALLSGLLGNLALQVEPGEYLGARNLKFALFPGSDLSRKKPKWLVASELVETGRRYLRTAAAIEPDWVEPLAGHLLKHSYSEPHWERKRAQVVAYERVTLYGLPLVQQRKVNYGPIDIVTSRELFIRHALVAGELRTHAGFADHNRKLLASLDQLESKARRRDVLVEEEELYQFFDERVPASVFDGKSFQRWWRTVENEQADLLHLNRDNITQHAAEGVTGQQFPDTLEIRGLCLPVYYRFSPGEAGDGLCVQLPIAALNQVQESDFDWLVPGLLRGKIVLLIKSLPKQLRRHFVPAPDYADACVAALQPHSKALFQALAEQLQTMTGVSVPGDAWRPELLPQHLFAFFELGGEQGKVIDSGRDLQQLQRDYGERARHGFERVSDARYERREIHDWDFGELPDFIDVENAGLILRAYPALAVNGETIELRLFDQQQQALASHREGLLALFRKKAGRLVREIKRSLPGLQKQSMWFSTVAGADVLLADLERAIIQAAFLGDDTVDVRNADIFQQRLEEGRRSLLEWAVSIGGWSYETLQAWQEFSRLLKGAVSPQLLAAIGEVQAQAQQLVYAGFVSATPVRWLPHLARYLYAAIQRLDKLSGNTGQERKQAATVRRYQEIYDQAVASGRTGEAVEEFRWLIEELRVSLFAQGLGTSVKVSPERLDRLWREITAAE